MCRIKLLSVLVLLMLLLSAGSGTTLAQEPPPVSKTILGTANNAGIIEPQIQKHVLNLAGRYLYEEVDDETRASILEDIRALSADEVRLLWDFGFAIQTIGFPEDNPSFADSVVQPQRQKYLLDLASRALYDEVDNETSRRIWNEIEALPQNEHQFLFDLLAAIQSIGFPDETAPYHLPDWYVKIREMILTLAEANGVSFIDLNLSETEIEAALSGAVQESPLASCPPGYVSCTYIPFTGATYRADCASGRCVTGSGYDRITEDPSGCEFFACDYRVWFNTPVASAYRGIDGVTSAADCVADRGPHAHRWDGSRKTEDEFGYFTVIGCGILSGDNLRKNMRVER